MILQMDQIDQIYFKSNRKAFLTLFKSYRNSHSKVLEAAGDTVVRFLGELLSQLNIRHKLQGHRWPGF